MQTAQRLTSTQRNRALDRLQTLKTGAVFVGVGAMVGFGWVAAISNPGTKASAAVTTGTDATGGSSGSSSSISGSPTSTSLSPTIVGGATSGGSAHATGGGS